MSGSDHIVKDAQAEMVLAQLRKLLRAVDGITRNMECEYTPEVWSDCDCDICALKAAAGDVHVFLAGLR
jgi:hypothetical protein